MKSSNARIIRRTAIYGSYKEIMIENDKKENKMDRKELEAQVLQMVAMSYKKDVKDLNTSTSFKEDLGGASVQMVALVSEIENELDVELMLSEASACATVGDLTDLIEKEL
jgi:acyl carrier protein